MSNHLPAHAPPLTAAIPCEVAVMTFLRGFQPLTEVAPMPAPAVVHAGAFDLVTYARRNRPLGIAMIVGGVVVTPAFSTATRH